MSKILKISLASFAIVWLAVFGSHAASGFTTPKCILLVAEAIDGRVEFRFSEAERNSGAGLYQALSKGWEKLKYRYGDEKLLGWARELAANNSGVYDGMPPEVVIFFRAAAETNFALPTVGIWMRLKLSTWGPQIELAKKINEILSVKPDVIGFLARFETAIHTRMLSSEAPFGYKRLYRGTQRPDIPQVSNSMRDRPLSEVPPGDTVFMSNSEAREHAISVAAHHPDGVSVSTNKDSASGYSPYVVVYDVPKAIFEQLPHGDATLGERVFKYSIPEKYRAGVLFFDKSKSSSSSSSSSP